jgi:Tfp pilus assembly major pilin PilA
MVRGKEDILNFFKQQNAPYWTVYHYTGEKNNFICKMEDAPNLSIDAALEKLESYLNWLAPGRYRLVCKRNYADNKGFAEMGIELLEAASNNSRNFNSSSPLAASAPGAPVSIAGPDGNTQVYVPQHTVSEQIAKALQDYEAKQEQKDLQKRLQELEKENKELKRESSGDVIGRILGHIEPHIPLFIEGYKKQNNFKSTISGQQMNSQSNNKTTPVVTEVDQEATEKLTTLIQTWENDFPGDPIAVIEKVVSIMKESPSKYQMYRNMLLS